MRVAVLSLCRDRLAFTQHCFASLREFAGCDYDHYVLDQGSQDDTRGWIADEYLEGKIEAILVKDENIGVSRGINALLDHVVPRGYDVIVKFDNDCELTVPDTLRAACEVAMEGWIASPHIMGLNSPPTVEREEWVTFPAGAEGTAYGYRIGVPNIMGGIFMACPAAWYQTYRHDESNPVWGLDDAKIVDAWRAAGGEAGYLLDYPANHYLTTVGQHDELPGYFERRVGEGGPP